MGSVTPDHYTAEWLAEHFDYLDPALPHALHPTLARMRQQCPITHSDARGGYWVLTKYDDVVRTAQDWETFSSSLGVTIPHHEIATPSIPEHIDPPLQRVYKKVLSAHLSPTVVREYQDRTREIANTLLDDFAEAGECEFMSAFAQPFPALAFFELVLGAPEDQIPHLAHLSEVVSTPGHPEYAESWDAFTDWIGDFVEDRKKSPPRGDIVEAIVNAEIEGRPVADAEIRGMIMLIILGGLETTAGVLGHVMMRFADDPTLPKLLREEPDRIPAALEELLRLDGSFVSIGRTTRHETTLGGCPVGEREKVLMWWASANRDEAVFANPDAFDLERPHYRHLAFGVGPHRCVGSNLARLNLRVALRELTQRLADIELAVEPDQIPFHQAFNRTPRTLPIRFAPAPKRS